MGFSLLDEWSRRNNPDYWLMRHGELLGKVVKTENKDGGFVAAVKLDKDAIAAAACNAYQTESKGESKMYTKVKTEAEIEYEKKVAEADRELSEKKKEEKREEQKKAFEEAATMFKDLYDAYIAVGFSEDKSWEICKMMFGKEMIPHA